MSNKKNKGSVTSHSDQNVVSGTEQTGLYPTPPMNDNESESYSDIYTMPAKNKGSNKKSN